MANVKEILIRGEVPFDWLGGEYPENVRAFVAMLVAGPSMGTHIEYGARRLVPNEHGGRTTMYQFTLSGAEALRFGTIEYLVAAIERLDGRVDQVIVEDIEDGHDHWYWTRKDGTSEPVPGISEEARAWARGEEVTA